MQIQSFMLRNFKNFIKKMINIKEFQVAFMEKELLNKVKFTLQKSPFFILVKYLKLTKIFKIKKILKK